MKHFFVTGLPRSRTAWLANLLTTSYSFCDHDALKAGFNIGVLEKRFEQIAKADPYSYAIGDSDSGLVFVADKVEAKWPGSPWLYVSRNKADALASFQKAFAKHNPYGQLTDEQLKESFEACWAAGQAVKLLPRCLEVEFDELDCPDTWAAIFKHLLPGHYFNAERAAMLNTFRTTIIPERVHCV